MSKEDRSHMGRAGLTAVEADGKQAEKSERDVQKQIANWLRLKGIFFVWSRMDKKTTNYCGTPDFIFSYVEQYRVFECVRPMARPMAIEVKFGKGKLSEEQEKVMEQMKKNGWRYHVVHSLKEVIELVKI